MTGLKRAIFQILSLSIILQAAILAAPFYLQLVVDKAVTANDSNLLLVLMLGFAGLAVLRALSEAARGWAIIVYGNQMTFQMVGNIFRHLIRLPAAYFEKRYIGDIISRIGSVRPIQKALTESVVAILIDGTMAVLTLAVLYIYSPLLGGVVTLMTGALVLVTLVLYPHLRRTEEEAIIARAIENGHVIESIQASTPIKLFGREAARESSWRNLFAATINASTAHGKFQILQKSAETLLIGLQVVIAVYLGAKLIMSDPSAFTVGMLLAYLFYQNHFTNSVTQLLRQGIEIRLLSLHLDRLADIVYAQSEASAQHRTAPAASEGNIKISNVGFRYSDNDPWVLKDVSLEIDAGSMVAITGKSGGGKTTLIKLILGLYQPVEGSIEVDGHALTDINIADWRAQVGVVMQEDQLLSGTIADNISFFDPEIDMEKVEIAAKLAQIHDEISEMPMKYLSMVGDMGSVLSGGQKQRVLLARALYNDPKVLILDEGTANLDPENEKKIADVLESMTITRIIVAHRPQLIDRSEEIYTI
jgi:ATP-binding cassette subfamily B protein RaxB